MPPIPTNPDTGALLLLTTFPEEEVARTIARRLVEEKLAACVSLLPGLNSIYFWQESVQEDREWLGLLKTRAAAYRNLERRLLELHPYENPEILAIDVAEGSERYLQWLRDTVVIPPA